MTLTRKLTMTMAAAILAVLAIDGLFLVHQRFTRFQEEVRRTNDALGRTLASAVAETWSSVGEEHARAVVARANERWSEVIIRWVWLDAGPDHVHRPAVPADRIAGLAAGTPRSARWATAPDLPDALYTYYAVPSSGSRPAAIEVRQPLEPEHAYLRHTIVRGALTTAILVVVCGLVAMVVGNVFVGRPVRRLVDQARRIGQGDLSARQDVTQRDELGFLAAEMNTMCARLSETRERLESETSDRIAALDQLRHADRLTTIGKLSAGLAHELGTPLNVIKGYAQLLAEEHAADTPSNEFARIIREQTERVAGIVRQLLDFGRQRSPRRSLQEIGQLARETTELLGSLANQTGARIEVQTTSTETWAHVDGEQMKQALTNLLVNAIQSMPEGGPITVAVDRRRVEPPTGHAGSAGHFACVSVRDHGRGIGEEDLARVFEPFFTTKAVGEGTGLGLSVSYGIVREHGGWIDAKSRPGAGSCFTIFVPAAAAES